MRAVRSRCKHCGKSYTYYASGWKCGEPYNNADYCPECQKAIEDALEKIPKRYVGRYQEIDVNDNLELIQKLDDIKKKQDEIDNGSRNDPRSFHFDTVNDTRLPFDTVEVYRCNNDYYALAREEDELHLFQFAEYDIIDERFTGEKYSDFEIHADGYHYDHRVSMSVSAKDITVCPLDPPSNKLLYMDIVLNDKPIK